MYRNNLSPDDLGKVNNLREIRQRNNDVAWMLCDYLNNNPCLITEELVANVSQNGILPEETAYFALLAGFCGLDPENNERDRQLTHDYFYHAIHKLDVQSYAENPYYRNIRIPEAKSGDWEIKYEKYKPYEAFICNDLLLEKDFREIPQIGFFKEEFQFPVVLQNDHEWMAIKPNEIETMQPVIDRIEGEIVTLGLGLGYFTYMASLKERVQSITVVERDQEVIRLFEQYILPQFDFKGKVKIIAADAVEFVEKQMQDQNFSYAFVDLWHDVSDGLEIYLRMKKLECLHDRTKFLYWIENSLLSGIRWQIFNGVIDNARSYDEIKEYLSNSYLQKLAAAKIRINIPDREKTQR